MQPDNATGKKRGRSKRTMLELEALEPRILLSGVSPSEPEVERPEFVRITGPDGQELSAFPDRLIIGFDSDVVGSAKMLLDEIPGTDLLRTYDLIGGALIGLPGGLSLFDGMALIGGLSGVSFVEPDYLITVDATFPTDPDFTLLYGMHNTGQTGGTPDADIDAPEAWDVSVGSSTVVVGVIDTGIDYTHPDLLANIWTNPGEIQGNGIDDDGNGYIDDYYGWDFFDNDSDPMDIEGHGTHVAGTIGAVANNGIGVAGVSWNVRLAALRFLGPFGGAISDAVDAVNYAVMMGFDLTNNSWGGGGYSQAMYNAIAAAGAADQLFVAAAGNDGLDNDTWPHYPASYDLDNVIAVALTDHNDDLVGWSNYGLVTVDLAAPGLDIYSTIPGNSYDTFSGTSMASPHVAGVAALLKSVDPLANVTQLRFALLGGVDPKAGLNGMVATGGRLNAFNSVQLMAPPVAGIELVPWSLTLTPDDLYGTSRVQLDYRVFNIGNTAATNDFEVEFYLSDDDVLGGDDHLIGSATITGLAALGSHADVIDVTDFPTADPFATDGDYYLLFSVDANDDVVEVDEANNLWVESVAWDRGAFFADDFSTDKGWTGYYPGQWGRGPAQAGGGQFGNPDPGLDTSPGTDNYLLGYRIGGDYENRILGTRWITSPIIDCSEATGVSIQFERWLNVEIDWFDHAYIDVFDGSSWVMVFANSSEITDSEWGLQEYDVSADADGNSSFRVRFGLGPTDASWRYSGWNIDDFRLVGDLTPESVPPQVASVSVAPVVQVPVGDITVYFTELMALYPLSDAANYSLIHDTASGPVGVPIAVNPGPDYVTLDITDPDLMDGKYTLTLTGDGLPDGWGNYLDGDENGTAGGDFVYNMVFKLPGLSAAAMQAYRGQITFYDTTGGVTLDDIDVRAVARIKGDATGGIKKVTLLPQYSEFGVVIEQMPGSDRPITIVDKTFAAIPISFIVVDGDVASLSLRSNLTGLDLNGLIVGSGVQLPLDIDGDGDDEDPVGLVVMSDLGHFRTRARVEADVAVTGDVRSIQLKSAYASLSGDVSVAGSLGKLSIGGSLVDSNIEVGGLLDMLLVKGNYDSSSVNAFALGRVKVGGTVTSTDPVDVIHASVGSFSLKVAGASYYIDFWNDRWFDSDNVHAYVG